MVGLQYDILTYPAFGQIAALCALLLGLFLIIFGTRLWKRTTLSRWQNDISLRYMRSLAREAPPREDRDEAFQTAQLQWVRQIGTTFLGGGAGLIAGILVSLALVQLALHTPFSLPSAFFGLLFAPPAWGMGFGFACGGIVAARRHALSRGENPAIAALEMSHKASGYRSPLLPLIAAFPAFAYSVITVLLAPHYKPFDSYEVREFGAIPPPHWILAIYPCALWLTVLLVEGCVWARVKAPAGITSPDTALARTANMALIGFNLAIIYPSMMVAPAVMGSGAMAQFSHTSQSRLLVFAAFASTYVIVLLSSGIVSTSQGRMGGRLTGWPWSGGVGQGGGAAAAGRDGVV